jgi:hypothetical protein
MDPAGTVEPGIGSGRHARLQSIFRVITIPWGLPKLETGEGNMIALNYSTARVDGIAGYGAIFGKVVAATAKKGPITPATGSAPKEGPPLRGGEEGPFGAGLGGTGRWPAEGGGGFGKWEPKKVEMHGVGLMAKLDAEGPFHVGAHEDKHNIETDADGHPVNSGHISSGALFFDDSNRDGPLFFEGKYKEPSPFPLIAPTHLTWDEEAEHQWLGEKREGMWKWWTEVPYGGPGKKNPDVITPRDPDRGGGGGGGRGRGGGGGGQGDPNRGTGGGTKKKIHNSYGRGPGPWHPFPDKAITPPTGSWGVDWTPPIGPRYEPPPTLSFPITPPTGSWPPAPPRQIVPRFQVRLDSEPTQPPRELREFGRTKRDAEGDLARGLLSGRDPATGEKYEIEGVIERVGWTQATDVANYVISHPMMESFAGLTFRPQLWVNNYPNFLRNPQMPLEMIRGDEAVRPQALAMHVWGAQADDGDWLYTEGPNESRARGGSTDGGVFFVPPHLEPEDYFGINSTTNVRTAVTTSYVMAAPGVSFALGTPNLDGGLGAKSVIVGQDPSDTTNDSFRVMQLNNSRVATELVYGTVDQGTGEVVVRLGLGGNQAARIPRGTEAQRPSTLGPSGGEIRVTTDTISGQDQFEWWDVQGAKWIGAPDYTAVIAKPVAPGAPLVDGSTLYYVAGDAEWTSTAGLLWDEANTFLGVGGTPASTLDVQGSAGFAVTSTSTTPYTLDDEVFLNVDASGGNKVVNLPSSSGISGRFYYIKKVDSSANTVTVTPDGVETIDGAATFVLTAPMEVVGVYTDGSNWWAGK